MVKLLRITENAQDLIEYSGRICYNSNHKKDASIIRNWVKSGHESVLEHAVATFEIECSRNCSHQLVRHRLSSFSQQSQRYVHESNPKFYVPPTLQEFDKHGDVEVFYRYVKDLYDKFLALGAKKEDARAILPGAIHTKLVMTSNFRQWRNFLKLRLSQSAQEEIRNIAFLILDDLHLRAPYVFVDLWEQYFNERK
jgi:thymidylate synthase (FAD)